jgi:hypothetical protein
LLDRCIVSFLEVALLKERREEERRERRADDGIRTHDLLHGKRLWIGP